MVEIWPQLSVWVKEGRRFALATVVEVQRSSPRGVGACLAVSEDGSAFLGSVSAGCVENEVIEAAMACLRDGETRWLEFGPDIGYPWEVSLTCGGKIRVRIEAHWGAEAEGVLWDLNTRLGKLLDEKGPGVLLSSSRNHYLMEKEGREIGDSGAFSDEVIAEGRRRLAEDSESAELEIQGERIFFRRLAKRHRLIIIGAVHTSIHLTQMARALDYETVVVDPRELYAKEERFMTKPDLLICEQPGNCLPELGLGGFDYGVALSHDPKIDDPALACFLKGNCEYIGALGSRKSHGARLKRLLKLGFSEDDLNRVRGPVGLDIGSRTPGEIAVSILAEIVAVQRGKLGAVKNVV